MYHGAPMTGSGWVAAKGPFAFPNRWVENREFSLGGWRVIYQPVIREILGGNYDLVVLGHEVKFSSNVLLALLCKVRGIGVLYWGFGYHVELGFDFTSKGKAWVGWLASHLKNGLTRLTDGYLAYTNRGAERLAAIGFPPERTYVLRNTIDVEAQFRIYDNLRDADATVLRDSRTASKFHSLHSYRPSVGDQTRQ